MPTPTGTKARLRNPRGRGAELRDEIVAAAGRLLDGTGRDEAITLRAVAREVGIAAPSIYDHFADREAIVAALIDESFMDLIRTIRQAEDGVEDPVERLRAGCRGYLDYARTAPHRYGLLFVTPRAIEDMKPSSDGSPGAAAFKTLVQAVDNCVQAGVSTSVDSFADAATLWAGLHGYATLHTSIAGFPWPADGAVTDHLVVALARLTTPAPVADRLR